jgi:hypothetical protein
MLYTILRSLIAGFQSRQSLVLENLALRHQVQVLNRGGRRPKLKQRDRALWVLLSRSSNLLSVISFQASRSHNHSDHFNGRPELIRRPSRMLAALKALTDISWTRQASNPARAVSIDCGIVLEQ